jgi:hypothetical protein
MVIGETNSQMGQFDNDEGSMFCISKKSSTIKAAQYIHSIGHSYIKGIKTLLLQTSKMKLSNGATLEAKQDLFLFNVEKIECLSSSIIAGGIIYLGSTSQLVSDNCMMSDSIKYIHKGNHQFVCNEENYTTEPLLENYCNAFIAKFTHYDEF